MIVLNHFQLSLNLLCALELRLNFRATDINGDLFSRQLYEWLVGYLYGSHRFGYD